MQLTTQESTISTPTPIIPLFPTFRNLQLNDKGVIEDIVRKYNPYSDYNFISLWSYNVSDDIEISLLKGNLVIKFHDYITGEPFYSFLGTTNVDETISLLLDHAETKGLPLFLKLIPQTVIDAIKYPESFTIEEDEDNFDYILPVKGIAALEGKKFRAKRNFVNRFKKLYPEHDVRMLDISNSVVREELINVFENWEKSQGRTRNETFHELHALERLLDARELLDLSIIGIYYKEKLIAFTVNELVHEKHVMNHFEKADISYVGVFAYLKHVTAKSLDELGYLYINHEQDLGLEGLRKGKRSWNPTAFLKKYKISRRSN